MPSTAEFKLERNAFGTGITILIDGVSLADHVESFDVAHGYNDPPGGYGPIPYCFAQSITSIVAPAISAGELSKDSRQCLLVCRECFTEGCWNLEAFVTVTAAHITWSDFYQGHRSKRDYSDFGPFVFVRQQYEEALRAIGEPI